MIGSSRERRGLGGLIDGFFFGYVVFREYWYGDVYSLKFKFKF